LASTVEMNFYTKKSNAFTSFPEKKNELAISIPLTNAIKYKLSYCKFYSDKDLSLQLIRDASS
jgi:hypothetical protein